MLIAVTAFVAALHVQVPAQPSADAPPRNVLLLVDTSDSMPVPAVTRGARSPNRNLVYEAAMALAAVLSPRDRVWLGTFGASPRLMTDPVPATEIERYARDLAEVQGGASPLWDALYFAAGRMEGREGAPAIIVITDGQSSANRRSFAEALDRLKTAKIAVYPVAPAFPSRPPPAPGVPDPTSRLRELANETGGKWNAYERRRLPEVLAAVVSAIGR
jgi:hypothetical protein